VDEESSLLDRGLALYVNVSDEHISSGNCVNGARADRSRPTKSRVRLADKIIQPSSHSVKVYRPHVDATRLLKIAKPLK
jgi:hypothetical protein